MVNAEDLTQTKNEQSEGIVVFGGGGFIGSHLLRKLASEGKQTLHSVDLRSPKFHVEGVNYIIGDVRDLSNLQLPENISTIYNLAAIHTTPGHPVHEYYETNVIGAIEVTKFARSRNINRIVFTSSISVYGPSEGTKSEASKPSPESAYGWSKWLAENVHRSWLDEFPERRLVICRPAVIFGRAENGNFTRLAKLLRRGIFIYPGRRDTIKACFYVGDLIDSIQYALFRSERYILFNGSYGDRLTIEQIVKTFKSVSFPEAREFTVPQWLVMFVATVLKPVAFLNLGIHPERVLKLVRSTDVVPTWLESQGQSKNLGIVTALERWKADSSGRFD